MSYMGTHNRIRRLRGSAREYLCECGKQAQEWAYSNHADDEELDGREMAYSRDLGEYKPMCFRCHRIYDRSHITHCPKGHPYSGANLIIDAGKRKCRACVYERNRKRPLTPEQRARKCALQRQRRAEARERTP